MNRRLKYIDFSSYQQPENYLFNNTKLETASTIRHDFGRIYEENGKQLIKLNLQIQFKK